MGDDPLDSEVSSSSSSSSSSKHNIRQPPSDNHDDQDDDEYDDDEDFENSELACPFCFEGFDAIGLFCHIDDVHTIETKSGICPVCGRNLGFMNLAGHLSTQHDTILKAFHIKIGHCDGDFHSVVSLLRKELKDVQLLLQSRGSSSSSSSKLEPDPLLSSFIYNLPLPSPIQQRPSSLTQPILSANNTMLQRDDIQAIPLSAKDEEKARRCEFVSSILFSTIHDCHDIL